MTSRRPRAIAPPRSAATSTPDWPLTSTRPRDTGEVVDQLEGDSERGCWGKNANVITEMVVDGDLSTTMQVIRWGGGGIHYNGDSYNGGIDISWVLCLARSRRGMDFLEGY